MYDSFIAWSTVGLLTVGEGPVPDALAGFGNVCLTLGYLTKPEKLSPPSVWYAMLCCYLSEACSFLNKHRGRGDEGVEGKSGRTWEERRERNCGQDVA